MAVAAAMDVSLPITAGAVISGSYFGDKLSPLSDTTNMAAMAAGVELWQSIRNMMYTSIPAFFVSCFGFWWSGSGLNVLTAGYIARSIRWRVQAYPQPPPTRPADAISAMVWGLRD
ncbi:Na+/H+ antiporter NhaC family protein [Escherichia coli]|uniref:Na+/H+ antiporter NhaC family protein n=1 Tax=Escherichia coli TaxID=562 RepID=UPI0022388AF0|nr:Na+/H+ antiporter NhaC family protein [Escherichia coli]MCW7291472.1 hypothetical protein [Escherichia coli]